ncbi:MAG: acylneuraminate cytidylyltransferase family protein [Bacteroidetes Order II. Incertae sedis bacterium]|nr:acylneuraminate cytidylyltransferase family protein [Bacteroidetes Order II. bacterium]
MRYLGFITARAGSKGIPHKNMRLLNGKPLIQYTYEAALAAQSLAETHLSSDYHEAMVLGEEMGIGVLYKRPEALASDHATSIEVMLYHFDFMEAQGMALPDAVVLLQPTSPIRSEGLIDRCIKAFEQSGKESLVAVSACIQHPYSTFTIQDGKNKFINPTPTRRQDYPPYYFITGSVYIATPAFLRQHRVFFNEDTALYETSEYEAIDIDTPFDLALASFILASESNFTHK